MRRFSGRSATVSNPRGDGGGGQEQEDQEEPVQEHAKVEGGTFQLKERRSGADGARGYGATFQKYIVSLRGRGGLSAARRARSALAASRSA